MRWFFAVLAIVMASALLSSCSESAAPPAVTSSALAPAASTPATQTSAPASTADASAWEKYKREVREAGFVNPNKDDGSISDDQTRQGVEAICQGPGGAKGLWELYDASLQMKPQQVDMPRIKRAATEFCASTGKGN